MAAQQTADDFGPRLKRARDQRGLSLRQIADRTKLSVRSLEALERDKVRELPGGIFVRSVVRAYAAAVGLDPETTVQEFLATFPDDTLAVGSPYVADSVRQGEAREDRSRRIGTCLRAGVAAVMVAGALLGAVLAVRTLGAPQMPVVAAPATPDLAPRVSASAGPVQEADDPGMVFEIRARMPTSVAVAIDGRVAESRTVGAGERLVVTADQRLTLTAADAGALQWTINSQPAVSLGARGEPRTVRVDRANYADFLALP
ncbi:MAG: DUF4115 domain-containing protein [Acidobacteria bacterium]|nr:DUF4115 domain-containing protein [Acidobacteriota bacterium]